MINEVELNQAQTRLLELGYLVGLPIGGFGPRTIGAISTFQSVNSLAINGEFDAKTLEVLYSPGAMAMPISEVRQEMNTVEIAAVVPGLKDNLFVARLAKGATYVGSIATALLGLLPLYTEAEQYIDPFKEYFASYPGWVWILIVAMVAALMTQRSGRAVARQIRDFKLGQINGEPAEDFVKKVDANAPTG